MKKKLILTITALVTSLFCIACGGGESSKTPNTGNTSTSSQYKDGTYTAAADPWQFGSEDATVVIKDGKISDITLRRLDKDGKEVNYDDWQGQEKDGKVYPNLKKNRLDMAQSIISKQNTEVDSISGSTVSTNNWKVAVQRALDKAKK